MFKREFQFEVNLTFEQVMIRGWARGCTRHHVGSTLRPLRLILPITSACQSHHRCRRLSDRLFQTESWYACWFSACSFFPKIFNACKSGGATRWAVLFAVLNVETSLIQLSSVLVLKWKLCLNYQSSLFFISISITADQKFTCLNLSNEV